MRKFKVGELINSWPCHTWDQLVDAVARQLAAGPAPMIMAQGQLGGPPLPPTRVLVMNSSGVNVPAGGALKLSAPLLPPDDVDTVVNEPPAFDGLATTDDAEETIVVVGEPVPDGATGFGHVLGIVWAKLDVGDEGHTHAAPAASSTKLKSAASGPAKIIWKDAGTGEKWAQLLLGGAGTSLQPVVITSSVAAATYDDATNEWEPATTTVSRLVAHEDGDGKRKIELGDTVDALSYYLSAIGVAAGQGRLAYLSGRELIVIDCTELTLPEAE